MVEVMARYWHGYGYLTLPTLPEVGQLVSNPSGNEPKTVADADVHSSIRVFIKNLPLEVRDKGDDILSALSKIINVCVGANPLHFATQISPLPQIVQASNPKPQIANPDTPRPSPKTSRTQTPEHKLPNPKHLEIMG